MAIAVDVPEATGLTGEVPRVYHGTGVDRPQAALQLSDRHDAVIHENLGEGAEDAVVGWVHDQGRSHPFPAAFIECRPGMELDGTTERASGRNGVAFPYTGGRGSGIVRRSSF